MRSCLRFLFAVTFFFLNLAGHANAQSGSRNDVALGVAGVATLQPDTLSVAAPLTNLTARELSDIKIERVRIGTNPTRTSLPMTIGSIRAHSSVIVQAEFSSRLLHSGQRYQLFIEGAYRSVGRYQVKFLVATSVVIPPKSEGGGRLSETGVPAHKVMGGRYPHQAPTMDKEVNSGAPPVPINPSVPGSPTPRGTMITPAPIGDPPAITFNANEALGITGAGLGCSGDPAAACAEPSGASGNGVIFVSTNWNVAYSTDGGSTFKILDPTTIFPKDAIGFCCDQVIQYAPSIDRFVWLLQGTGYRLAMASPADIKNNKGTAWTYWNLTPSLFGKCTGPDYPDLSIGDNSLYISWDAGGGSGCTAGFQVVRTSLAGVVTPSHMSLRI